MSDHGTRTPPGWRERVRLTVLAGELEQAHVYGVGAASAGLQDAGLGPVRLTGSAVPVLAEAAVTSATPFLRAPLLSRLHRVRRLHTPHTTDTTDTTDMTDTGVGVCPACGVPAPCPTARELDA